MKDDTQPLRVVLDRTLRIPRKCALLTDNKAKTVIMYSTICTMESRVRDVEDEIRGTGVTLVGIDSLTDVSCYMTALFVVVCLWAKSSAICRSILCRSKM